MYSAHALKLIGHFNRSCYLFTYLLTNDIFTYAFGTGHRTLGGRSLAVSRVS